MKQKLFNVLNYVFKLSVLSIVILVSNCKKDDGTNTIHFADTTTSKFSNPYDAIKFANYPLMYTYASPYWMEACFSAGDYVENNYMRPVNNTGQEGYMWIYSYRAIYLLEEFINNINSSSQLLSKDELNSLKGQAYFTKALAYYNLIRVFGKYYPTKDMSALGVPIISGSVNNKELKRATVKDIHDKIVSNLDSASSLLPEEWSGSLAGNPTKYAAKALLAKVYVWFQENDKAETLLEQIINSNKFQLMTKFTYNFDGEHENNSESIFELQYYPDGAFWYDENYYKTPSQAITNFCLKFFKITDYAKKLFGNDPRYDYTVSQIGDSIYVDGKSVMISNNSSTYFDKIKKFQTKLFSTTSISTLSSGTNIPLIRLADIYLLYSELQLNKGNNQVAVEYMNKVRRRAYSSYANPSQHDISGTLSTAQLTDTLRIERFRELYGEANWWFDMIRWDIAAKELNNRNFYYGESEAMPIPGEIITQNPGIIQNK